MVILQNKKEIAICNLFFKKLPSGLEPPTSALPRRRSTI